MSVRPHRGHGSRVRTSEAQLAMWQTPPHQRSKRLPLHVTGALPPPGRKLEPDRWKMLRPALNILPPHRRQEKSALLGMLIARRRVKTARSGGQKLGNEILALAAFDGGGQTGGAIPFLHQRRGTAHLEVGLWN